MYPCNAMHSVLFLFLATFLISPREFNNELVNNQAKINLNLSKRHYLFAIFFMKIADSHNIHLSISCNNN